jgi:hypothetical protein
VAKFEITRRNGDVFVVQVDDEDLERVLAAGPWFVQPRRHTVYVQRNLDRGKSEYLHRFLLPGFRYVDHKDSSGLNNQRDNLRGCTATENNANRRANRKKAIGLKGVSLNNGAYIAQIQVAGSHRVVGRFATAESAHAAYCQAADAAFGEFARHR